MGGKSKFSGEGSDLAHFVGNGTKIKMRLSHLYQLYSKINKPGQLPEILRLNQMKRCKPV